MAAERTLYVARRVPGANGGITRISGLSNPSDGAIPIPSSRVKDLAADLFMASQLAYDIARDELLLTLQAHVKKSLPWVGSRLCDGD